MERFEGLVAAAHSPMHADGTLALDVVENQAGFLREQGIVGVFICGSTGEGHSLSREERMSLAEAWKPFTDDSFKLIVHAGCNALPDAKALARHASEIGAHAVSCQAPCYEKPRSIEALVDFLADVAVDASSIPFYWYDIPALTGVRFSAAAVLDRAASAIPNLVGLKFTSDDGDSQMECLALSGGRFEVLHGSDELLLDGLQRGCRAAVGSTYNYAAAMYRQVMDLHEIGDLQGARHAQERAVRMIGVLCEIGVLRAGKEIMGFRGVHCGPPRLPATPLSQEEAAWLKDRLDGLGCLQDPLS